MAPAFSHSTNQPMFKFNNGDRVKDRITGLTGIVCCQSRWYNGCVRYAVQAEQLKDGAPADLQHIDEQQLTLVKAAAVEPKVKDTGGPCPAPQRRLDPSR